MNHRIAHRLAAMAILPIVVGAANADTGVKSDSKAAVQRTLQAVEAATVRGDSAAAVSAMLYSSDVVMVGEGDAGVKTGMKAAIEEVAAWWASLGPNGQKGCRLQLAGPAVSSATTFTSFVIIHCDANPPTLAQALDVRCLYSWKKLPEGWRVAIEQWGVGKF